MNGPLDHARELLTLAEEDLGAGEAIIAAGKASRTACFHAQQAAEKSLKALLAADDVVYPWTHDLGRLVALLEDDSPALRELGPAVAGLTEYAVDARYDLSIAPDVTEARSALDTAQEVYALAEEIIAERGSENEEAEAEGDEETEQST